MVSSRDIQLAPPVFAPKRVKELSDLPRRRFVNTSDFERGAADRYSIDWRVGRLAEEGLFEGIYPEGVSQIAAFIEKTILEKKQLTKQAKDLIDLMLAISLNGSYGVLETNRSGLIKVLNLLEADSEDFNWFYKRVTSHLSQSQLLKMQEAVLGLRYKNKKIDFASKHKLITEIIKLFNHCEFDDYKITNIHDSTSFLGLDASGKEAIVWQKLELSRSGDGNLARLAGVIAWRNWLFKEPILKAYCLKNGIDFNKLPFSKRAALTKKAISRFSKAKLAEIIDESIQVELDRRKKSLEVEENPKFINKRVSMGIELEMSGLIFELAIIYAWYENLDRSLAGDSIAYSNEIERLFKQMGEFKDQKEVADKFKVKKSDIAQIIKSFRKDLTADELNDLKKQVEPIISDLPDKSLKDSLELWLKDNPINLDVLQLIQKIWETKFDSVNQSFTKSRESFRSLFLKTPKTHSKYISQSVFANEMPPEYPDIAKKLLDIFKHHMGQIQPLGHKLRRDAFGEYALAHTSGNFKDPYRFNLRETWELAKTAFHNLNVDNRPMHVTIGWKEDVDKRRISISLDLVYKESSLLNFALMSTGWTNRSFITEFKEKNEAKLAAEGTKATVSKIKDIGQGRLINFRESSRSLYGVEFRGFSPAPGMDQARLFSALGNLGTAMKAYMVVESVSDDKDDKEKVDDVDLKLHKIWQKFRNKVEIIYGRAGTLPSLFKANDWQSDDFSQPITNFYLKMSEDLDKDEGLVADMRKLIQETISDVDQVFDQSSQVPDKESVFSSILKKIGFKK